MEFAKIQQVTLDKRQLRGRLEAHNVLQAVNSTQMQMADEPRVFLRLSSKRVGADLRGAFAM
jgi:hypothetical protein